MFADLFALLQTRPNAVAAAIVGNTGGRADAGAGIADEVTGTRKDVGHLLSLLVYRFVRILLLEHTLLRLVDARLQFSGVLDEVGRRGEQLDLFGGAR